MTELFEEEQIERARIKHQRENARLEKKFSKVSDEEYITNFMKGK